MQHQFDYYFTLRVAVLPPAGGGGDVPEYLSARYRRADCRSGVDRALCERQSAISLATQRCRFWLPDSLRPSRKSVPASEGRVRLIDITVEKSSSAVIAA